MTHTKDEAMKLALEALETELAVDMTNGAEVGEAAELMCEAITAIKAALEAKDKTVEQPKVRTGDCLLVGVCASEGHKIQPQRTWVGLTDEERKEIHGSTKSPYLDLIVAEAKLKEKNT